MIDQLDIMVTTGCQARCPFCVQEATFRPRRAEDDEFLHGVRRHAREFHSLGGRKVVITGGEPLLRLDRVLGVLEALRETGRFDLVALYTNGEYLLASAPGYQNRSIPDLLASAGLDCVNLSVHHFDDAINNRIFGRSTKPPTITIVGALKEAGLDVRFNLVLQKGGIENFEMLDHFVNWAFSIGAKDVYVREIFRFAIDRPLSQSRYNPLTYCETHHVDSAPILHALRSNRDYRILGAEAAPFRQKVEYSFLHLSTGKRLFLSNLAVGTEDSSGLPYLVIMPNALLYRGWLGAQDRINSMSAAGSFHVTHPTYERGQPA